MHCSSSFAVIAAVTLKRPWALQTAVMWPWIWRCFTAEFSLIVQEVRLTVPSITYRPPPSIHRKAEDVQHNVRV